MNDRHDYLRRLATALEPGGRFAIVEQEFDGPVARKWDIQAAPIPREPVKTWMSGIGFELPIPMPDLREPRATQGVYCGRSDRPR